MAFLLYSIVQRFIDILHNVRSVLANLVIGLNNDLQIKNYHSFYRKLNCVYIVIVSILHI